MIGGEFDLSIGSIIGFAGIVIGLGVTEFHLPLELAILVAFAFAVLIGYVNGLLRHPHRAAVLHRDARRSSSSCAG